MDIRAALEVTVTTGARGQRVVGLSGELDLATGPQTTAVLALTVADEDTREIIMDLTDLRFIDANGLGVLIRALRQAEELHRSLRVHNPRGEVDMLLRLTGLAEVLGVPHVPAAPTGPG